MLLSSVMLFMLKWNGTLEAILFNNVLLFNPTSNPSGKYLPFRILDSP